MRVSERITILKRVETIALTNIVKVCFCSKLKRVETIALTNIALTNIALTNIIINMANFVI